MLHWLTDTLGTAKIEDVQDADYTIVDVRDLVDKAGNAEQDILKKIETALNFLQHAHQVVICCDYGISRSNAIAVGVLVKGFHLDFDQAVQRVVEKTEGAEIGLDLLNSVRTALRQEIQKKGTTSQRTILITGGTGFIGQALIAKLQNQYRLIVPDRKEIDLLNGSLALDAKVNQQEVHTIIHLANPRIYARPSAMGQSLVMLKNVLDACKEHDLQLIYLSGWVVYSGYQTSWLLAPESLPLCPKGTYGETKMLCEALINQFRERYDLKVLLLRASPVYGVGSDKPKFIQTFFRKALRDEPIVTHKYLNGFPVLDLIHIYDIVNAMVAILTSRQTPSYDVNIGSGMGYSTFDIANIICELCDSKSLIQHHEIRDFTANIIMDIRKAKKDLTWYPSVAIKDGLKEIKYSITNLNL